MACSPKLFVLIKLLNLSYTGLQRIYLRWTAAGVTASDDHFNIDAATTAFTRPAYRAKPCVAPQYRRYRYRLSAPARARMGFPRCHARSTRRLNWLPSWHGGSISIKPKEYPYSAKPRSDWTAQRRHDPWDLYIARFTGGRISVRRTGHR